MNNLYTVLFGFCEHRLIFDEMPKRPDANTQPVLGNALRNILDKNIPESNQTVRSCLRKHIIGEIDKRNQNSKDQYTNMKTDLEKILKQYDQISTSKTSSVDTTSTYELTLLYQLENHKNFDQLIELAEEIGLLNPDDDSMQNSDKKSEAEMSEKKLKNPIEYEVQEIVKGLTQAFRGSPYSVTSEDSMIIIKNTQTGEVQTVFEIVNWKSEDRPGLSPLVKVHTYINGRINGDSNKSQPSEHNDTILTSSANSVIQSHAIELVKGKFTKEQLFRNSIQATMVLVRRKLLENTTLSKNGYKVLVPDMDDQVWITNTSGNILKSYGMFYDKKTNGVTVQLKANGPKNYFESPLRAAEFILKNAEEYQSK